jgi:hypothetical protein
VLGDVKGYGYVQPLVRRDGQGRRSIANGHRAAFAPESNGIWVTVHFAGVTFLQSEIGHGHLTGTEEWRTHSDRGRDHIVASPVKRQHFMFNNAVVGHGSKGGAGNVLRLGRDRRLRHQFTKRGLGERRCGPGA